MSYHFLLHPIKGLAGCQLHKQTSLVLTLVVKYLQTTKEECHCFKKKRSKTRSFPRPTWRKDLGNHVQLKAKDFEKSKCTNAFKSSLSVQPNIFGIILFKIF